MNIVTVKNHKGFSLVELLIVIAIVALLAGIALPSYQRSVVDSTRKDAAGVLMGFSQAMERHHAQSFSYKGAATGGADVGVPTAALFPSTAPIDGQAYYNLSITAADDTSYTLRATPIAGSRQDGDGFLEINSVGVRSWDKDNNGTIAATENTWDR